MVVVDVGPSLVGSAGHARAVQALEAARRVLRTRLEAPRARDTVGVVLYGTHETRHALADSGSGAPRGVFVAYDLGPPCAAVLRFLAPSWALAGVAAHHALPADPDRARLQLAACGAPHGDLLAALAVALDMLAHRTDTRRAPSRRVFLVSDLCGPTATAATAAAATTAEDDIVAQLRSSAVRLNVIDVGAADAAATKAEPGTARAANLALLARITAALGPAAAVVPLPAALDLLTTRRPRSGPLRTCYRCAFVVTPDLRIGVHAYIKCREQPFPKLTRTCEAAAGTAAVTATTTDGTSSPDAAGEGNGNDQGVPGEVRMTRTLHAAGDTGDAEAGAVVARADAVRAYRYGKTLVPFGAADEAAARGPAAERGLTLLGFTRAARVPRHAGMGGADLLVADPGDRAAQRAFAALVAAMAQTGACAVCRLVAHRGAAPALVALVPRARAAVRACACWVLPLPFAEDLRYHQFAPLLPSDRRARPDAAPSPAQRAAARRLVDAMSLVLPACESSAGSAAADTQEERQQGQQEQEEIEFLAPKRTCNPAIRRFFDVVNAKTVVPGGVHVTAPADCAELGVPAPVRKRARAALDDFGRAFPLEPVAPDTADPKQYWRSKLLSAATATATTTTTTTTGTTGEGPGNTVVVVCGESAMDATGAGGSSSSSNTGKVALDDVVAARTSAVGSVQPARDFAAMLARRDADLVLPAMEQLRARIRQFVRDSIGGQYFAKALDALVALRRGCVAEDEPALFNALLCELQQQGARASTAGDTARFWAMVAEARVLPISHAESLYSPVSADEAARFHAAPAAPAARPAAPPAAPVRRHDEAIDDLFDMAD